MERLIDLRSDPVQATLKLLLKDKATQKNIIWATNTYKDLGTGFQETDEITEPCVLDLNDSILQPRASKSLEEQKERTRVKAEVMTPSWLCNKMNNYADECWFGNKNVFNTAKNHTWRTKLKKIHFPEGKKWQDYVDSRRIEITCGEAPFLVSRYDTVTGKFIVPFSHRIGFLDRKMRVVNENVVKHDEWLKWAFRAFESCYGYEYQGDNLLIARINMLMSFHDCYLDKWKNEPNTRLLRKIANIIAWNLWQMDGLNGLTPPYSPHEKFHQLELFDLPGGEDNGLKEQTVVPCKVFNWRSNKSVSFAEIKGECYEKEIL